MTQAAAEQSPRQRKSCKSFGSFDEARAEREKIWKGVKLVNAADRWTTEKHKVRIRRRPSGKFDVILWERPEGRKSK